ncbi:MAG: MBL fold metallo-hydrolase [Sphingopyxis sp.]
MAGAQDDGANRQTPRPPSPPPELAGKNAATASTPPARNMGAAADMARARADASLAGQVASPDASLLADDGLTATSHAGLLYPWGARTPQVGEVLRMADSLSWARIPMPGSLGHINTWLLDDDGRGGAAHPASAAHNGGVAVVDTGLLLPLCSDAWKALFSGPLADVPVTRVLCTHLHPDHIGLAGWIAKRFDAPIWMTRGEWLTARYMIADVRDEQPAEVTAQQRGSGWDDDAIDAARARGWGQFARMIFRLPHAYRRMVDGELLQFGRHEWRVVVGSGHSPEHACLWNERDGLLVSGDQVLPRISSNVSLHAGEPDADPLGEWLASIDRLMLLPDDVLVCPAHGDPFTGLHVRLAALRDEHHQRLDALAAALTTPGRVVDCFSLLFKRDIGDEHRFMATGEALAHLRHLEVTGRVVRATVDGVWWWSAT